MAKEIKKKENVKKIVKKKEGFIKGIKKELNLVKWPSAKDIVKYTISTVIFCIILAAFFISLNVIMAYVKGLFS